MESGSQFNVFITPPTFYVRTQPNQPKLSLGILPFSSSKILHIRLDINTYTKFKLLDRNTLKIQRSNKKTFFMKAIIHKLCPFLNIKTPTIRINSFRVSASTRNITMSESDQAPPFDNPRLVVKKVQAKLQQEGDGAVVRRGIGRFIKFVFLIKFWFMGSCFPELLVSGCSLFFEKIVNFESWLVCSRVFIIWVLIIFWSSVLGI